MNEQWEGIYMLNLSVEYAATIPLHTVDQGFPICITMPLPVKEIPHTPFDVIL